MVARRSTSQASETQAPRQSPSNEQSIISLGDPITVNLADTDHAAFLRCSVRLGLVASSKPSEALIPMTRDLVIRIMAAHTSASLLTTDGRQRAKAELLSDINAEGFNEVRTVYFTDFLVQR